MKEMPKCKVNPVAGNSWMKLGFLTRSFLQLSIKLSFLTLPLQKVTKKEYLFCLRKQNILRQNSDEKKDGITKEFCLINTKLS